MYDDENNIKEKTNGTKTKGGEGKRGGEGGVLALEGLRRR